MEVPRLGVKSELQLQAYTTATAMPDPSWVCDLHHRSWQHQIFNPLSKARDQTHILVDTSRRRVPYCWATWRTATVTILMLYFQAFAPCSHFIFPGTGLKVSKTLQGRKIQPGGESFFFLNPWTSQASTWPHLRRNHLPGPSPIRLPVAWFWGIWEHFREEESHSCGSFCTKCDPRVSHP